MLTAVLALLFKNKDEDMKIYIVIEGSHMGQPDTMDRIVLGVFSSKKTATKCLRHHASYIHNSEQRELFFEAGILKDKYNNIYLELLERELDQCRKETWL